MEYFARIPLFKALTDLEMYKEVSPETDDAARAQAGALMALYNVRYFITTPPIPGRFPYQDTWQRTEQYALDVLPLDPNPIWQAEGYRVYRVNQPAIALPFRLDLGTPGNEPYLGEGWDARRTSSPTTQRQTGPHRRLQTSTSRCPRTTGMPAPAARARRTSCGWQWRRWLTRARRPRRSGSR